MVWRPTPRALAAPVAAPAGRTVVTRTAQAEALGAALAKPWPAAGSARIVGTPRPGGGMRISLSANRQVAMVYGRSAAVAFDLQNGSVLGRLWRRRHHGVRWFLTAALSPRGRVAVLAGQYRAVYVWDVGKQAHCRLLPMPRVGQDFPRSVGFFDHGKAVLASLTAGLCVWRRDHSWAMHFSRLHMAPSGRRLLPVHIEVRGGRLTGLFAQQTRHKRSCYLGMLSLPNFSKTRWWPLSTEVVDAKPLIVPGGRTIVLTSVKAAPQASTVKTDIRYSSWVSLAARRGSRYALRRLRGPEVGRRFYGVYIGGTAISPRGHYLAVSYSCWRARAGVPSRRPYDVSLVIIRRTSSWARVGELKSVGHPHWLGGVAFKSSRELLIARRKFRMIQWRFRH